VKNRKKERKKKEKKGRRKKEKKKKRKTSGSDVAEAFTNFWVLLTSSSSVVWSISMKKSQGLV